MLIIRSISFYRAPSKISLERARLPCQTPQECWCGPSTPGRESSRLIVRWNHRTIVRWTKSTSPRPPLSRCMKTFVKSLPVSPHPISDSASLKPPRDRNGPLAPPTPPASVFITPDDAAATAAAAAEVAGWDVGTAWRKYPADRRRLEREKKPAGPRRANRFRATCRTLEYGEEGERDRVC